MRVLICYDGTYLSNEHCGCIERLLQVRSNFLFAVAEPVVYGDHEILADWGMGEGWTADTQAGPLVDLSGGNIDLVLLIVPAVGNAHWYFERILKRVARGPVPVAAIFHPESAPTPFWRRWLPDLDPVRRQLKGGRWASWDGSVPGLRRAIDALIA